MHHQRLAGLLLCFAWSFSTLPVAAQDQGDRAADYDGIRGAFANGQVKTLLRYSGQYRDSNLHLLQDSSTPDISDVKVQQYTALGGFVGFETAPLFHTTIGATLYGAMPFGNNPDNRKGLGGLYEADGGQDAYAVLGEAFVKFQKGNHMFKVGRQEMPDYRMVSLSNIRFSPITHSGAVYENRSVENLSLNLGYIMRMKERNATRFIDMARGARVKVSSSGKELIRGEYDPLDYDEDGYTGADKEMTMLGLEYQAEHLSIEGWSYYVEDFINALYLAGQYDINPSARGVRFSIAAQYTQQWHVTGRGDALALWGLRFTG